jgi:hypothetical protein
MRPETTSGCSAATTPCDEVSTRVSSSRDGIPYLCPEIVLLYKASERSPKNEAADFALARARLSDAAASWLACALETCHPQHPWLSHLPRA